MRAVFNLGDFRRGRVGDASFTAGFHLDAFHSEGEEMQDSRLVFIRMLFTRGERRCKLHGWFLSGRCLLGGKESGDSPVVFQLVLITLG